MRYRRLSLLLDHDPLCAVRTAVAIWLARSFDAHLLGIAPTGLLDVPVSVEGAKSLSDYAERARAAFEACAQENVRAFAEHCAREEFTRYTALIDLGDKAQLLVRHAQSADLLLLSQPDPGSPEHRGDEALLERAVLGNARPTLVLPHTQQAAPIGSRILVAWDESRESARAIADAMPLLEAAGQVHVVYWNPGRTESHGLDARLADLRQWLRLHGVSAEVHVDRTAVGIAETLLSRAADMGIDLIVMGAYSRGPWAERVVGGVTRKLLASMTVPVLLSH